MFHQNKSHIKINIVAVGTQAYDDPVTNRRQVSPYFCNYINEGAHRTRPMAHSGYPESKPEEKNGCSTVKPQA